MIRIFSVQAFVVSTQSGAWIGMARLLRRTGFGATGVQIDQAVKSGPAAYVQSLMTADFSADRGVRATPMLDTPVIASLPRGADRTAKLMRNEQTRRQLTQLTAWWIRRMVAAEQPFGEKLTLCWHNHFATSATKVRHANWLVRQNNTFRRLGRGDFGLLAQAMLVDAAMLDWLDGQKNTVNGANENLAREFMELFTLGHEQAYGETDVREGARVLTGWRIAPDGSTALRERLHDDTSKTVLGVTGNLDQSGFCNAVLAQPASARHVATRCYLQLVSDTPPSKTTLDRLVEAYGPERSLHALFTALLTDPSFGAATQNSVANPVEWLVGAVRALKVPILDDAAAQRLAAVLRSLGQLPFHPPNVSGWPSGQAWLSTAAAEVRMHAATALTAAGDLSFVEAASVSHRIDAVGYLLGVGGWSDRTVGALKPFVSAPPRLVAVALNAPEYLVH
jgi:uncharacterized protein (DUF1800 family)